MSVRTVATLVLVALAMPAHGTAQVEPAANYIAAIEAAQPADDTATLAGLTLPELMERFNVPGVSVAVIRDFEIHWAKGVWRRGRGYERTRRCGDDLSSRVDQ
jgi:hypothetical protein